jgi:signal peptidase II
VGRSPRYLSPEARALHGLDAWARALSVAALVMVADQVTKQLVVNNIARRESVELIFGFEISNARNSGIAFGLLEGSSDALVLALTLGALALLVGYFGAHARRPELWLPVGLVVGGALGNLADRVRIGAAIDFLDPPLWPAFNIADIAIVAGVGLFVALLLAPDGDHAPAR